MRVSRRAARGRPHSVVWSLQERRCEKRGCGGNGEAAKKGAGLKMSKAFEKGLDEVVVQLAARFANEVKGEVSAILTEAPEFVELVDPAGKEFKPDFLGGLLFGAVSRVCHARVGKIDRELATVCVAQPELFSPRMQRILAAAYALGSETQADG